MNTTHCPAFYTGTQKQITIRIFFSILLRFTENEFYENMQSTVGMDYKTKQITIDGNTVKLAIWVCN
jgi:hypothetical protein